MNQEDLQQNLRSIRNGKESSSFMLASLHALEDSSPLAWDGTSEYPPDFAIELAHKAIDNGADVFLAHGVHHLRGVEIYKGKPIFYGLSHFTFQLNQQPTFPGSFAALKADPYHTDITDAEAMWAQWASTGIFRMDAAETLQSMIVECKYDGPQLLQVILHPIELGYGSAISERGIPHIPSPEVAQEILRSLQRMSEPFGTTIEIQGNVGVIHVARTNEPSYDSVVPAQVRAGAQGASK
jgi:poly-gamma-glutamate synthesis protein (capsule biosynthesis protein)